MPGLRPPHFHYFLGIFLLEEAINAELGFALSVAIALLGVMAVHSRALLVKGVPLGSARTLALLGLVVLYQIPSSLAAPADCPVSPKFLATTLTFVLVAWSMWWLRPEPSIFSEAGTTWLLRWIAASLILAQVGLDLMTVLGNEPRIRSGFYSEPSHLALHLLPLVAYRLLHNFKDRLTWFNLALVMVFAPSSTLAMGLLGVGAIKLGMVTRSRWVSIGLPLLAMGILGALAASIDGVSILNRIAGIIYFNPDAITNLSSPVWLNGWSQSFDHFMASDGWGVGFNQMGCGALEAAGFLSPLLMRGEGFVVNSTDGSFLFAKIVAELGWLGMLACLYLSWQAVKAMLALSRGFDDTRPDAAALRHDMICRAAAGVSLLVYLYVRGMSYFAFPTMLAVCVLLRPAVREQASFHTSLP